MLKKLLLVAFIAMVVLTIGYAGIVVYGNMTDFGDYQFAEPPGKDVAPYMVSIQANNNVLYTRAYQEEEKGLYMLDSYWSQGAGGEYRFHDYKCLIDERKFGVVKITLRR